MSGNCCRRCDLDAPGCKALAWSHCDQLHEPYRYYEQGGRQERRVDGKGHRRAIPRQIGTRVRARLGGREVIPPPSGYQLFTPVIDMFLKEHLFADIFARDNLDFLSREIATVGALSSLEGVNPMLRFHMGAAMNVGLTESQAKALVALIGSEVGKKEGDYAGEVLQQVLDSRAK
jgi:alkylhydroperoxidase/carboxymuconolactone decarboxylase family protein YurZ